MTNVNREIIKYENFDGGVAQSVERRNHNPCVVGSNPSLATNKKTPSDRKQTSLEACLLGGGLSLRHLGSLQALKNALAHQDVLRFCRQKASQPPMLFA